MVISEMSHIIQIFVRVSSIKKPPRNETVRKLF